MDAEQRTTRYKNLMARQYDAMVKPMRFNIGDLVLKSVSLATETQPMGKCDLIGKDPTGSLIAKGRDHTTWKPWMDESWSTLVMSSI